ncbi:AfsA-related hotdog domain-containing protein [Kitasatospora sp. NPDC092948]|uniref:AfsA-related hotdog domain-containing protein n=1 Tax=Kitasatospora sp. NPDC092948 TaxID=3364088 RepID=UPI0037F25D65
MTGTGGATEAEGLRFDRTVDRRLLHRRALSEVFLTDSVGVDSNGYLAGAQLPSSHSYFTDHAGHVTVDPMLLLECARQAETYGAHVHLGVDDDTKFILKSWTMSLPGLFGMRAGDPAELTMLVTADRPDGGSPTARSVGYDIRFSAADRLIGEVHIEVGYLSSALYQRLRTGRRTSPVLSSDQLPATTATVTPASVGRQDPLNALLIDPVRDGTAVTAGIRLPSDNPSMFDHAQDHLPGMVLTEAARQLCLLTGSQVLGHPAEATTVTGFDLSFGRFAELDTPTTVTATPAGPAGDGQRWNVVFHQDGAEIATGTVDTATVPAALRRTR